MTPLPLLQELQSLYMQCAACRRCPHGSTRNNLVFSKGDPLSTLAFVGEAPGSEENEQGLPFIGRAGQLLDKQIKAMRDYAAQLGVEFPESPYVCNVVKCQPPGNKLLKDGSDVQQCSEWLWQQLCLLPNLKVIVALGKVAAQTIVKSKLSLGSLRDASNLAVAQMGIGLAGLMLDLERLDRPEIKVIPTYHPAYLLRNTLNSQLQLDTWSDLKKAVETLQ